jgi:O-6-methylguanine DNA methyltransferase
MKEQIQRVTLPPLPIVGTLRLSSRDGKSLCLIEVVRGKPSAKLPAFFADCHRRLHAFLSGETKELELPLDLSRLSPFQLRVLKAMKEIPFGKTATYKDLALKLKSRGYQAIGSACGRNPFLLIYPCHRVVGSSGPGGFAHGLKMKSALLALESR